MKEATCLRRGKIGLGAFSYDVLSGKIVFKKHA